MTHADTVEAPLDAEDLEFVPRWRPYTTMALSVFGLGVAIYLTIAHYSTSISLSCPLKSSVINCEKVTTSPQSYIFHVPVAVLGLAFFVPMIVLSLPATWRSSLRVFALARLGLCLIGIATAIYLVHAELFEIHAICIWCTTVHVITLVLFVIVVTGWYDATANWDRPS